MNSTSIFAAIENVSYLMSFSSIEAIKHVNRDKKIM